MSGFHRHVPFSHPGFEHSLTHPLWPMVPSFGDPLDDFGVMLPRGVVPRRSYYVSHPGGVQSTDSEFRVSVEARNFAPEELNVKIVENDVIIHGKHEEKTDAHGSVKREFVRQYKLPEDVDPSEVTSSLSADGVLSIKAPRKGAKAVETSIPITIEKKPALEGSDAAKE